MAETEELVRLWWSVLAQDLLLYLLAAGTVFTVLGWLFAKRLSRRRIQDRRPSRRQIGREFLYSLSTVVIFTSVGFAILLGPPGRLMKIYFEIEEFGWFYAAGSLMLMLVLHDTYFYWTHRLMHHRRLFPLFHRVHHLSRTPTPWAAYSFAPPEALVQALFQPIVLLFLPLHPLVMFLFVALMIVRNALGHSGVEIFWRGFPQGVFGWSTTVTHHDLHHQRPDGNYGLYFTWWDRWMGTEHADYHAAFRRVTAAHGEGSPA